MRLFPRLQAAPARRLANELRHLTVAEARDRASCSLEDAYFPPSGGAPVGENDLVRLAAAVREAAEELGYPDDTNRQARAEFDVVGGRVLHTEMDISPAEASEEGVWTYLTCRLLPDLVAWRFGPTPSVDDRFLTKGRGVRNTFGRLWWRWEVLGEGDLAGRLLRGLGEDQIVQIMERPVLASARPLARAVARCFLSLDSAVATEALMRDAMKRFQRLGAFVRFEALSEAELDLLVRGALQESLDHLADDR
ncbi:DUF6339 family protein [Gemmatimonadota bacterium Y43]|uniref:DUF6339 family protein n=1 Tax=Gaopeijia maritima TaxID=3119007 RepID=UPI00327C7C98